VKGIPTAIPYDVVRVGEGYGSVFELLSAQSFSKILANDPSQFNTLVALFVGVLKKIHGTEIQKGELPSFKETALDWVKFLQDYLSKEDGAKLQKMMEAIPDLPRMIHGDYHTKNVMKQGDEVLLIDMDTLSYRHPIFELAGMYLSFVGFGELNPNGAGEFLGIPYSLSCDFFEKSLALYLGMNNPQQIEEVLRKARIIGYVRLARWSIRRHQGQELIDHCFKNIHLLMAQTDGLYF